MTTTEHVEGRVRTLLAAWDARNLDALIGLLAPDVYWHDLGMPHPPAIGRETVRRFCESVFRAFPDFSYTIRSSICVAADGLSCVVPWTITATNTGVLDPPGVAPTGRRVRFDGLDYLQFRDGLITRIETRFDPVEPLEQLLQMRFRPPPGSLRERILLLLQRLRAAWLRRAAGWSAAAG
jgi:predicted ester cyclase